MFDYSVLDPAVAERAKATAERIRDRMRQTAQNIYEIGHELLARKKELGHGHFMPWVSAELKISQSTAENYMRLARSIPRDKFAIVADFKLVTLYSLVTLDERVIGQVLAAIEANPSMDDDDISNFAFETDAALVEEKERQVEEDKQRQAAEQQPLEEVAEPEQAEPLAVDHEDGKHETPPETPPQVDKPSAEVVPIPVPYSVKGAAQFLYDKLTAANVAIFVNLMGQVGHDWQAVLKELNNIRGNVAA